MIRHFDVARSGLTCVASCGTLEVLRKGKYRKLRFTEDPSLVTCKLCLRNPATLAAFRSRRHKIRIFL